MIYLSRRLETNLPMAEITSRLIKGFFSRRIFMPQLCATSNETRVILVTSFQVVRAGPSSRLNASKSVRCVHKSVRHRLRPIKRTFLIIFVRDTVRNACAPSDKKKRERKGEREYPEKSFFKIYLCSTRQNRLFRFLCFVSYRFSINKMSNCCYEGFTIVTYRTSESFDHDFILILLR